MISSDLQDTFDKAVNLASSKEGSKWPLSTSQKSTMYGCYKQVNVGNCEGSRPGVFNPVARHKYDAWKEAGALNREEAMAKYIAVVEEFAPEL